MDQKREDKPNVVEIKEEKPKLVRKEKKIDYLSEDKPIQGQQFVCISFLSPEGIKNCSMRGLKIRGVYPSYEEAKKRADDLQHIDPDFDVFVGEVGKWLPWDSDPNNAEDQVYREKELQDLMCKYKENLKKVKDAETERKNTTISVEKKTKKERERERLRKKYQMSKQVAKQEEQKPAMTKKQLKEKLKEEKEKDKDESDEETKLTPDDQKILEQAKQDAKEKEEDNIDSDEEDDGEIKLPEHDIKREPKMTPEEMKAVIEKQEQELIKQKEDLEKKQNELREQTIDVHAIDENIKQIAKLKEQLQKKRIIR